MASAMQAVFVALAACAAVYYSGKGPQVLRKLTELVHGKPGCAPVADVGNVTLHYFAVRGRGEVIRLLMAETQIPFSEVNFNKDSWPQYKKKGTASGLYTFSQVPAIEMTNGEQMAQSLAIAHYLGRATGLDCDCQDLHFCEVLVYGAEDLRSKLGKMLYSESFSLVDREDYLNNILPVWLERFENLAPALTQQEAAYFASQRLTWVDFVIFDLLENHVEFSKYDFGSKTMAYPDILAAFPKLSNFYKQFAARPRIAAYMKSSKRFPYKVPNMPKTDTGKKQ